MQQYIITLICFGYYQLNDVDEAGSAVFLLSEIPPSLEVLALEIRGRSQALKSPDTPTTEDGQ